MSGGDLPGDSPLFLDDVDFETEGSPLSLPFWKGEKSYQFLTNYIGLYPVNSRRLARGRGVSDVSDQRKTLEAVLKANGLSSGQSPDVRDKEFFSDQTDPKISRFFIDKTIFSRLPEGVRNSFLKNYKQSFRWEMGYLRKAAFEPWLEEILEEKNNLDSIFKDAFQVMYGINDTARQKRFSAVNSMISSEYSSGNFEEKMIATALKEIGYEVQEDASGLVALIFRETNYSLENMRQYLGSRKTIMKEAGIEVSPGRKKAITKEERQKILKTGFSIRFFDECKEVFGEHGIRQVAKASRDSYIAKEEQYSLLDRLKELLSARKLYLDNEEYSTHIKGQLEELFSRIGDLDSKMKAGKEMHEIINKGGEKLKKKYSSEILSRVRELDNRKRALEEKVASLNPRNRLGYNFKSQRMLLFLDIMHRDSEKKPYFDGISFGASLTEEELKKAVMALFDIEKFQFGSIKEVVSGCATIVKDSLGNYSGQLDFLRPLSYDEVAGFKVRIHEHPKELVRSIAEFINNSGAFLKFSYGSYDFRELKKTREFKIGNSSNQIIPRQRVHIDFFDRYEPVGSAVNLLSLMMITRPHLQNHRLGTIIGELNKRAGTGKHFKKSHTHEQIRSDDKLAEKKMKSLDPAEQAEGLALSDGLGYYTVSDVKELMEPLMYPANSYIFEDLLDACYTFGITMDQAASSYNAPGNAIEKGFFNRFGTFVNRDAFYESYQAEHDSLVHGYTEHSTRKLLEQRLEIDFKRGLIDNVSMLYFSPEILIAESLYDAIPELKGYIEKTFAIKDDPERQIGRAQFVRPLVIRAMTELGLINNKKKELDSLLEIRKKNTDDAAKQASDDTLAHERKIGSTTRAILRMEVYFKRMFGVVPEDFDAAIESAYKKAAGIINAEEMTPLQIKGSFIYAHENLSPQALQKAGLFRAVPEMTIYNMRKNGLTYNLQGQYEGFPSRLDIPNNHYSLFEIETVRKVLERVFSSDFEGAKKEAQQAFGRINGLEGILSNPERDESREIIDDLMRYKRKKNRYLGIVGIKSVKDKKGNAKTVPDIREYTPDARKRFKPYLEYYSGEFIKGFFGVSRDDTKIDVNATLPRIFGGIINMGEDNLPTTAKKFRKERADYRRIFIDDELPLFR